MVRASLIIFFAFCLKLVVNWDKNPVGFLERPHIYFTFQITFSLFNVIFLYWPHRRRKGMYFFTQTHFPGYRFHGRHFLPGRKIKLSPNYKHFHRGHNSCLQGFAVPQFAGTQYDTTGDRSRCQQPLQELTLLVRVTQNLGWRVTDGLMQNHCPGNSHHLANLGAKLLMKTKPHFLCFMP